MGRAAKGWTGQDRTVQGKGQQGHLARRAYHVARNARELGQKRSAWMRLAESVAACKDSEDEANNR